MQIPTDVTLTKVTETVHGDLCGAGNREDATTVARAFVAAHPNCEKAGCTHFRGQEVPTARLNDQRIVLVCVKGSTSELKDDVAITYCTLKDLTPKVVEV